MIEILRDFIYQRIPSLRIYGSNMCIYWVMQGFYQPYDPPKTTQTSVDPDPSYRAPSKGFGAAGEPRGSKYPIFKTKGPVKLFYMTLEAVLWHMYYHIGI